LDLKYPATARASLPEPAQETPKEMTAMDRATKTTTEAAQAFAATAEKGSAQAIEAFDKMSASTAESAELMRNSYSTAIKGAQDYNNKILEFTQANTKAAMDFVQRLSGVKSPSEFMELSTEHSREQFEVLIQQSKELAALAQQVMHAAAEPLKAGATKAFNQGR
jgi:phasin